MAGSNRTPARPLEAVPLSAQAGDSSSSSGYTREQLKTVLETIASRARTLDLVLMALSERSCDQIPAREMTAAIDAAQLIANGIGAMADTASGGGILGDSDVWLFGPNFAAEGKAVQS